jgi:hypothetical protein
LKFKRNIFKEAFTLFIMVVAFAFHTLPVVISVVASMILGFLWYGPFFGKIWMRYMGITPKRAEEYKKSGKSMASSYVLMIITTAISVTVLGMLLGATGGTGTWDGIKMGILAWVGFIATFSMGSVLWEGKPWGLWFLNNSYSFLNFVISGAILGTWM